MSFASFLVFNRYAFPAYINMFLIAYAYSFIHFISFCINVLISYASNIKDIPMNPECKINIVETLSSLYNSIYFYSVIAYLCTAKPPMIFVALSTFVYTISFSILNCLFVVIPGDNLMKIEKDLTESLSQCERSLEDKKFRESIKFLFLQIENQPMKLVLFKILSIEIPTVSIIVMEIFSWCFTLLQFDLESNQDN
ncbi:CLUMA_CG014850, isoform A [Clunio marinus]|uniref:CLUMA_CG014850, isoform A n=1 Tax=Clunio marinus TaxID=568069 RepID=A0A1J1ILC6_9DIPT|nr:CLUMA_CG014850, isoform A [Clunio marinus]